MIVSRRTSAHVHSVFEVNFSRMREDPRRERRPSSSAPASKLTYLSFIMKAAVDALRADADRQRLGRRRQRRLSQGDQRRHRGRARLGADRAGRSSTPTRRTSWGSAAPSPTSRTARAPSSSSRTRSSGGTFTITNPGVFGALFGMPIINQPQVAILGVGNVEKRPVVVDDAIAIRPMAYLTLGYDHRVIDGAVADEFMSIVKKSARDTGIRTRSDNGPGWHDQAAQGRRQDRVGRADSADALEIRRLGTDAVRRGAGAAARAGRGSPRGPDSATRCCSSSIRTS